MLSRAAGSSLAGLICPLVEGERPSRRLRARDHFLLLSVTSSPPLSHDIRATSPCCHFYGLSLS